MAKLNVEISDSLHKALKRISVDKSTPMKKILTDLIEHFVSEEQKGPTVQKKNKSLTS